MQISPKPGVYFQVGCTSNPRGLFVLGRRDSLEVPNRSEVGPFLPPQLGGETGNRMQEVIPEDAQHRALCSCVTAPRVSGQPLVGVCDLRWPCYEVCRFNPTYC